MMIDTEMHPVPPTPQDLFFIFLFFYSSHPLLTPLPKQDVQTKLRDAYKKTGDEFMTNRIATQAKVRHILI